MNTKKWARSMRARIRRERVKQIVDWARKNGVEELQRIYETARSMFPAVSEENAHNIAKVSLKKLKAVIPNESIKRRKSKGK